MNDRERWVIYPLLFLALGAALKDKMIPSEAKFRKVECDELVVARVSGRLLCEELIVADSLTRQPGKITCGAVVVQGRYPSRPGTVQCDSLATTQAFVSDLTMNRLGDVKLPTLQGPLRLLTVDPDGNVVAFPAGQKGNSKKPTPATDSPDPEQPPLPGDPSSAD